MFLWLKRIDRLLTLLLILLLLFLPWNDPTGEVKSTARQSQELSDLVSKLESRTALIKRRDEEILEIQSVLVRRCADVHQGILFDKAAEIHFLARESHIIWYLWVDYNFPSKQKGNPKCYSQGTLRGTFPILKKED